MAWSEGKVIESLMPALLQRGHFALPNTLVYGWEADLLGLSTSGMVTEYEIKVSRADFKADFKKQGKHDLLAGSMAGDKPLPNYFYYVCPFGLLKMSDVPDYAGLLYVTRKGVKEAKRAPILHKQKVQPKQQKKFFRSMNWRLWERGYAPKGWKPSKMSRTASRRRNRRRRRR